MCVRNVVPREQNSSLLSQYSERVLAIRPSCKDMMTRELIDSEFYP